MLPGFDKLPNKGASCFEPARDIVAAPYSVKADTTAAKTYADFDPANFPKKELVLFFAGGILPEDPTCSGRIRQVKTSIRLHAQHGTLQCTMPNGACFSELDTRKEVCFALGYQRSLRRPLPTIKPVHVLHLELSTCLTAVRWVASP